MQADKRGLGTAMSTVPIPIIKWSVIGNFIKKSP